ncbi:MAG: aldolase [Acidimicrobiaceae bacterium]|nr:aldolase/citrate lyase family protein [Acidimicrobiaceae bacterium]MDE0666517.1 aldolase/citrate lyase family protein [Acidimicrobiaceae bacterium]MXY12255.1 aldolase [Acidimicrobiaceae bacterium]MXZ64909.1 aldolase [Acidimicrobiaceae bacterium]MYE56638.1 aldolase [Acidimicrobiaceae bacterium]
MRERWAAGEAALGGWLAIPSSFSAEIVARCDLDYVCVDTQHGLVDYSDSWPMLQAVNLGSATPLVRVPWNEPGIIGKSLDAGARGIIVPMVNTRAQAEAAVAACRYAPEGGRSYGPARVVRQEGSDYYAHANADVAVIPMIETVEALTNLDDILSVPGVDAAYVGPSDLSVSLGLSPGNNDGEAAFDEALAAIAAGCVRHGVIAGCHTVSELCPRRIEQGFRMITITSDTTALARALEDELRRARGQEPVVRSGSMY